MELCSPPISAAKSSANMRGTFSINPPPVMWAIPFTKRFLDKWQDSLDIDTGRLKKNFHTRLLAFNSVELLPVAVRKHTTDSESNHLSEYHSRASPEKDITFSYF